nr:FAD-dependent oxidoreductase [Gordonia effusa]
MRDRTVAAGITRRELLKGSAIAVAGASALSLGTTVPQARANPPVPPRVGDGRDVAIFGGGMAGLSAAHELIERGYTVTVYEPAFLGGKARSMPVSGTGTRGRYDLPGEHGFRFFPGCYQHVPNTMSRIPIGASNVKDAHLVAADALTLGLYGDPYLPLILPAHLEAIVTTADTTLQLKNIQNAFIDLFRGLGQVPLTELTYFAYKMTIIATSCDERRIGQWDNVSWYDYIKADQMSPDYGNYLATALSSSLVAAKAKKASARTIAQIGLALAYAISGLIPEYSRAPLLGNVDMVLNRPTNQAWIDPWVRYLKARGVQFAMDSGLAELTVKNRRITKARVVNRSGRSSEVSADWYVAAMPLNRIRPLLTTSLLHAAPHLEGLTQLQDDWMVGIQYYLSRRNDTPRAHVALLGSPWALTAIFQAKVWGQDLARTYGDGRVREILSVDISNWDEVGVLYGKTAKQCTAQEIAREVWVQLRRGLNRGGYDLIRDRDLIRWHLDPGITWRNGQAANATPLLINTAGSYAKRPTATTEINNLFIGGDHVRSNIDLATMEGANESGRRVANGILDATDSSARRAKTYPLHEMALMDPLKDVDRARWHAHQPHIFDIGI